MSANPQSLPENLKAISALISQRRFQDASHLCETISALYPESAALHLAWCHALKQSGQFEKMLEVILPIHSMANQPDTETIQINLCATEAYIFTGKKAEAITLMTTTEKLTANDHVRLQHVAEMYSHCLEYRAASRCYRHSLKIAGNTSTNRATYQYNLAASLISLGELEEAEELLDQVILSNPQDFDAYQNRSTLRRQTLEQNHIKELRHRLGELTDGRGVTQLCYALSKELEDIGDFESSFQYLKQGADDRRKRMKYDVGSDVDTMAALQSVFSAEFVKPRLMPLGAQEVRSGRTTPEKRTPDGAVPDTKTPIFICGLPRSGTTLVDRIVSSHSDVTSLGEINDFALGLVRSAGRQMGKQALVHLSRDLDHKALGQSYLESVQGYVFQTRHFIDKTPANFLYLGLVCLSLPEARILHLKRHPMDSCYAMYKTLFRMGYPFSYNLDDIADYYIAYDKLMRHWRSLLAGRFLDIDYEQLVSEPLNQSQTIIDHCRLHWEDACANFHLNPAPAATASAAQVRQPIYTSSVARWRRYEKELKPLAIRLENAGIRID